VNQEVLGLEDDEIKELVARIANNDSVAFQEFYGSHVGLLYSTIYRVLNDHRDTQDVLQEVCLQLWMKASLYEPSKGKPLTWITTMARNRAIDRLRSKKRRTKLNSGYEERLSREDCVAENLGLSNLTRSETQDTVREAVGGLSDDQREAIELTYFGGLTQQETAERLGEPLGTVKARIRRGIIKLRGSVSREDV